MIGLFRDLRQDESVISVSHAPDSTSANENVFFKSLAGKHQAEFGIEIIKEEATTLAPLFDSF